MPNVTEEKGIHQHLKSDKNTEMMRYELELMLERELAKPAEAMDTQLIEELLGALEESPPEADKQAIWEAIQQKRRHPAGRARTVLRRIAACAAILVFFLAATIGSAYAFNWTFLLKLLAPFAETFGIYSANDRNSIGSEQSVSISQDSETEFEQRQFDTLEDFPTEREGYRLLPAWLPEGFSFLQGSLYEDESIAVISNSYEKGDARLRIVVTFFEDDGAVSSYEYHRVPSEAAIEVIADITVTCYANSDGDGIAASWIDRNVHYSIVGDVAEDEIWRIVSGMIE